MSFPDRVDPIPSCAHPPRREPLPWLLTAFAMLGVVLAFALVTQRTPIFEDDVLFFFRYADNLAAGNGYRFNAEEAPVWGASAPLWPLLIALGQTTGLDAGTSCLVWSWLLTLTTALILGLLARRHFGLLGVLCLVPILAFNHLHSTWATSGMESPLTFLLVALGLWVADGGGSAAGIGVVAGLCLVHKLDLAPFGLALLAGTWVWRRPLVARAALVALAVAGAWYAFAWWHFGSPIPNSFLQKLHADYASVGPLWFVRSAFGNGYGPLRAVLALVGAFALRRRPFLASLALVQVLVPTLGYTLRPPAEGFMWYVAAIAPTVAFLAACGLAFVLRARPNVAPGKLHIALVIGVLVALGVLVRATEQRYVLGWHRYLLHHQLLLKQAGEWVAENSPAEAKVFTHWGNPAYYSHRFVYDGTYLNRRPEEGEPLVTFEPEIWITSGFKPLAEFRPRKPYRVAQAFEAPEHDYFVAVLFRADFERSLEKQQELERLVLRLRRSDPARPDPELAQMVRALRRKLEALPEAERLALVAEWPELGELERWLPAKAKRLAGTTPPSAEAREVTDH